jgi:uroporphyrinogen-III synthase
MSNVILTRASEENIRLAPIIAAMGFEPFSIPMLQQKDLGIDINLYSKYEYLIITSKFAAKIIAEKLAFKAKIHVVGEESARILRENKFAEIAGVYENIDEVSNVIARRSQADAAISSDLDSEIVLSPKVPRNDIGDTIYFCGSHITKALSVKTVQIYETTYFTGKLYNIPSIDNILLFSEISAEHFLLFIKNNNLLEELKKSVIICISAKVAKKFENLSERVYLSGAPDEKEMLELLKKYGER